MIINIIVDPLENPLGLKVGLLNGNAPNRRTNQHNLKCVDYKTGLDKVQAGLSLSF